MDALKTLVIVAIVCLCSSAGATYLYTDNVHQTEMNAVENYYQNEKRNLQSYIHHLENETIALNDDIETVTEALEQVENELSCINQSLQENLSEIALLQSGTKYDLHDPTYLEVARFIAQDKTDENIYDNETFDCEQFSQIVNNNAEEQGIRCAYVVIYFYDTNTGHAIIGFDTIDQGMVYIEPQTDEWVINLVEGNEYWTDCVVPKGGYYYEDAPHDTIQEILVFW